MHIRPEMRARYPKDWALRSRVHPVLPRSKPGPVVRSGEQGPHPVTGSEVVLTVAHMYDRRPEAAEPGCRGIVQAQRNSVGFVLAMMDFQSKGIGWTFSTSPYHRP